MTTRRLSRLTLFILALVMGAFVTSCTKTVKYRRPSDTIKPLDTQAKRMILHEDYLFAESNSKKLKSYLLDGLRKQAAKNKRFTIEVVRSGKPIPRNNGNNPVVFVMGDIWLHQGKSSGDEVRIVSRSKSGFNSSRSWDEIEKSKLTKKELQTIVSLYFVEVSSETRLLRATLTTSSDIKSEKKTGGRNVSNNQFSDFYVDKKLEPAHIKIKAGNDIERTDSVLRELADRAVTTHFQSI